MASHVINIIKNVFNVIDEVGSNVIDDCYSNIIGEHVLDAMDEYEFM